MSSVANEAALKRVRRKSGVMQIFMNADLRNGHMGLAHIAKASDIDVTDLFPGQYVVFINGAKDKIKVYAANNVVAYHRSTSGRLELGAVHFIPLAFKGGDMDFDSAVKRVLERILGREVV